MANRKTTKIIIAVCVISLASVYLLYVAMSSSWTYYYSVDEFVETKTAITAQKSTVRADNINNRLVRLAGWVKEGTVKHNTGQRQLSFELAGLKHTIPVIFVGAVPKNFSADKEVVVEGRMDVNGTFQAEEILTRCESKYKVKLQN
ncbi:MAG: cytochrome c maturation protein CcmE [Sedimentisphaerales bacterium]|nr:cytochrome c maturation protein CcmE [Sedimentisphaerales bacterium]